MANCRNCPDTYTVTTARYSPAAPNLPAQTSTCPSCGGLECLCRPRFFDGQLLSADDLTRLERYIVGKNRLHNRYLHGWGVVCGLEVVCDPCKDQVIVRQGYALSPCGDDIVVCADVTVPICDLITQCRRQSDMGDCYSNQLTDEERGCKDTEEDWVLSICYDEKPSRGITPLRASSGQTGCSRCGCGGSSTCGCSCHEKSAAAATQSTSRYAPAQCEPSVNCEGFRFTATKVPPKPRAIRQKFQGEMTNRFRDCYRELVSVFPDRPENPDDPDQMHEYCCALNDALSDFFSAHSSYNCQLDEKLAATVCPRRTAGQTDADYLVALKAVHRRLREICAEYLRYCFCSSLLPACPESADSNCVPLATVTIRRSGCRIVSVCNFSARRFAVTVPGISYWLSSLPIGDTLLNFAAKYCCQPVEVPDVEYNFSAANNAHVMYPAAADKNAGQQAGASPINGGISQAAKDGGQVYAQAWASRSVEFDPQYLILDAMGATDAQGLPFLSAAERRDPLATLLANQIAIPFVESFLSKNIGDISNLARTQKVNAAEAELQKAPEAGSVQGAAAPTADAASRTELEALKSQVDALKQTVDLQQRTIDTLSSRPAKKA